MQNDFASNRISKKLQTGWSSLETIPCACKPVEEPRLMPPAQQCAPNVQELFSFIESVLSSWFVEEGAYTSQGESEPESSHG